MPRKPQYSSPELKKTADAIRKAFEEGRIGPRVEALIDSVHGPKWKERQNLKRETFDEVVARLRVFAEEFGHTAVPQQFVTRDGYALGRWVMNHRNGYKGTNSNTLNEYKVATLEALPGWSWGKRVKQQPGQA